MNVKQFLFYTVVVILAITANTAGFLMANNIAFPLYLDSLLTIAVVALCGFIPGLICAIGSNMLLSVYSHSSMLFSVCHICTAVSAWLAFSHFRKTNKTKAYILDCFLWAGIFSAISNGILGNLIADFVYASNTGRPSATIMIQCIYSAIPNLTMANIFGGLLENIADKILSALLSYAFYFGIIKIHKSFE